jgi:hypothetical protein
MLRTGGSPIASSLSAGPLGDKQASPTDANHRDTVHSLIDGYGHNHSPQPAVHKALPAKPVEAEPVEAASEVSLPTRPAADVACGPPANLGEDDEEETLSRSYEQAGNVEQVVQPFPRAFAAPSPSEFEPPVTIADIEAIARQPSPGRYQHGAPLNFVGEEDEGDEEDEEVEPRIMPPARGGKSLARSHRRRRSGNSCL